MSRLAHRYNHVKAPISISSFKGPKDVASCQDYQRYEIMTMLLKMFHRVKTLKDVQGFRTMSRRQNL